MDMRLPEQFARTGRQLGRVRQLQEDATVDSKGKLQGLPTYVRCITDGDQCQFGSRSFVPVRRCKRDGTLKDNEVLLLTTGNMARYGELIPKA